ncbi:MAG: cupredoxin domain-containing protein, partial [Candidatus Blackburnbacteria bacterium]|nr:cupredoxin domain-containing protein [Candidatus Blackburnbacteria bacterium]
MLLVLALPQTVLSHSEVRVVKMTSRTFEPAEITVDQNATIIFVNQDEIPRWPASNIHPTHELYPEFDPKREIKPGETWSFKPKNPGTWKYHDHLNPHIRGIITVTSEDGSQTTTSSPASLNIIESVKNFLSSLVERIRNVFAPAPKLESYEFKKLNPEKQFETLTDFARKNGGSKAWSFILEAYKGEAGSIGNIHDLAHLAGKLIYEDKGIQGIGICTATFAFGCYHGLLDAAFKTSLADLPKAEKECEKVGQVNSGPYGSCIHGIGHGVASFHQSKKIRDALKDCDRLREGRNFCYDGVFMEFARSADPSFYSKSRLLYPCDELEQEYGTLYSLACGRNQPSVLMGRLGMEFNSVARVCENNTLGQEFKDACFSALGFSLASSQDESAIIAGCRKASDAFYVSRCLQAAAGELIFQDAPSWQDKSVRVCDASTLPFRQSCHEHLRRLIQDYGKELEEKFNLLKEGQDKDEYVRSQMGICYESGGKDSCYKKVAELFSNQLGLKDTLAIFQKNEQYPEIFARCHETTHYLSRNEYDRTKSIPSVYAQCNSTCHGGCYHGVLEQYLKDKQSLTLQDKNLATGELQKEFPKVCGKIEDFATPLVFNECLHGMGHAAMFVTDMEVPDSLSLCDIFDREDARERCYGGVFMENSSSSTNNDHPGRYVKGDDPLFPCNSLPEKYSKLCYRYQSSHFALITNHNWQKTAQLCLKVPQDYQDECFRTIGTNQVGFTQNVDLMKGNCLLMPTTHFKNVCIQGVVSSFAYRFVGDD